MMLYFTIIIEAVVIFLLMAIGNIRDLLARAKKEIKVIVDTGQTYEITYAKRKGNMLKESVRKKNRAWIISDPEDLKYNPNDKLYFAAVSHPAITLNKDIIQASKLAWQDNKKLENVLKEGFFSIQKANEEIRTDKLSFQGVTIDSKYVEKALKAKSSSHIHEQIEARANQIASRQNAQSPMKSFMYGFIGVLIALGVFYLMVQNNAVDVGGIVKSGTEVARNATQM